MICSIYSIEENDHLKVLPVRQVYRGKLYDCYNVFGDSSLTKAYGRNAYVARLLCCGRFHGIKGLWTRALELPDTLSETAHS